MSKGPAAPPPPPMPKKAVTVCLTPLSLADYLANETDRDVQERATNAHELWSNCLNVHQEQFNRFILAKSEGGLDIPFDEILGRYNLALRSGRIDEHVLAAIATGYLVRNENQRPDDFGTLNASLLKGTQFVDSHKDDYLALMESAYTNYLPRSKNSVEDLVRNANKVKQTGAGAGPARDVKVDDLLTRKAKLKKAPEKAPGKSIQSDPSTPAEELKEKLKRGEKVLLRENIDREAEDERRKREQLERRNTDNPILASIEGKPVLKNRGGIEAVEREREARKQKAEADARAAAAAQAEEEAKTRGKKAAPATSAKPAAPAKPARATPPAGAPEASLAPRAMKPSAVLETAIEDGLSDFEALTLALVAFMERASDHHLPSLGEAKGIIKSADVSGGDRRKADLMACCSSAIEEVSRRRAP